MGEIDREKWQQHIDAARHDSPERFLALMHRDGVALGQLQLSLDDAKLRVFRSIHRYYCRWVSEGGPHPDTRPRRPDARDVIAFHEWRRDRSGHSELEEWNASSTRLLRGRWAGVLQQVIDEAKEPRATRDRPSHLSPIDRAAFTLLEQLELIPPWKRFPDDLRQWTEQQILERFPAWQFVKVHWESRNPPGHPAGVWIAYRDGSTATWSPEWQTARTCRAGGSQGSFRHLTEILLQRPATAKPDLWTVSEIQRCVRASTSIGGQAAATEEVLLVRNEWAERKAAVAGVREGIDMLADNATRAVARVGGREESIRALVEDPYLHDDVVDAAVAELRRAVGDEFEQPTVSRAPRPATHEGPRHQDLPLPVRAPGLLGDGGPAKTLDAVRRAILAVKPRGTGLRAGDETTLRAALSALVDQDAKKGADYLAPSGRLCAGGWIDRDGERVILTEAGAVDATARLRREQERGQRR